jgi:hypothetical protein
VKASEPAQVRLAAKPFFGRKLEERHPLRSLDSIDAQFQFPPALALRFPRNRLARSLGGFADTLALLWLFVDRGEDQLMPINAVRRKLVQVQAIY